MNKLEKMKVVRSGEAFEALGMLVWALQQTTEGEEAARLLVADIIAGSSRDMGGVRKAINKGLSILNRELVLRYGEELGVTEAHIDPLRTYDARLDKAEVVA